ncbi:MAG: aminoglycoside phosphotransferase family protein [Anaerolineales bacterium]|nr:aminoglycoside phosphotransferase family protein [Anaerolineales bacterium]
MSFEVRDLYKPEVERFLQQLFPQQSWTITRPASGSGGASFYASNHKQAYFIKLGAQVERYQVLSELGLAPEVVASGALEDGTSILVQPRLVGRTPTGMDFARHLKQFAEAVGKLHRSQHLLEILPPRASQAYREVGLEALADVKQRWEQHQAAVAHLAPYVNQRIAHLEAQVSQLAGQGLVASHGDICNANWLVTDAGQVYLLDLESMSQDDPAHDLGAILWWYYPPELRSEFLAVAGYRYTARSPALFAADGHHFVDPDLQLRMRLRLAIHSLHILLPRQGSFDRFSASRFEAGLQDFKAVVAGSENPKGYWV